MAKTRSVSIYRLALTVVAGLALCAPARPQAVTQISNVQIPIDLDPNRDGIQNLFQDPCLPEPLILEGTLHIVVKTTLDARGVLHVHHSHNPQGVRAVGARSGQVYNGSGSTHLQFQTIEKRPFQFAFLNVFNLIGRGRAPNFHAFDKLFLTLDEDGKVIGAFLDQLSIRCR